MDLGPWRLAADQQTCSGGDTEHGTGTKGQMFHTHAAGADFGSEFVKLRGPIPPTPPARGGGVLRPVLPLPLRGGLGGWGLAHPYPIIPRRRSSCTTCSASTSGAALNVGNSISGSSGSS